MVSLRDFWSEKKKHFYDFWQSVTLVMYFLSNFKETFWASKLALQMKKPFVFAQKPSFNPLMLSLLFLLWDYCALLLMLMEHAWVHILKELMDCLCGAVKFQEQFRVWTGMFWQWTEGTSVNGYTEELETGRQQLNGVPHLLWRVGYCTGLERTC